MCFECKWPLGMKYHNIHSIKYVNSHCKINWAKLLRKQNVAMIIIVKYDRWGNLSICTVLKLSSAIFA